MSESIRVIEQTAKSRDLNESASPAPLVQMYQDALDVLIIRNLFPKAVLDSFAANFGAIDENAEWHRPNNPMPGIDLRLLGVGAAPTASTPVGPDADAYFAAADTTPASVRQLFGPGLDPFSLIEAGLEQAAGVPVCVPITPDQRSYSPCTVRAMPDGQGLMLHHDNHFPLAIYDQLREQLDTSLLGSFFVQLRRPTGGGRLCVYAMGPEDDGDMPRLEHGMLDPVAFHQQVPHQHIDLAEGDMIVFGSSRLYHRVEPVIGDDPRITIGGFLGLSADHRCCLYWS